MSGRVVKLTLEYDGAGLCGWQRQANGPTVQGHLEAALRALLGADVAVAGASRTDAGVHAEGQVASFHTDSRIPLHGFRHALNAALPSAIAVVAAEAADDDFHARFSARGKLYRYTVLQRPDRSPLRHHRAWHRSSPIDHAAVRAAAAALIGEHDFSAFRAAGCTAQTPHRRLDRIELRPDGDLLHLEVEGNAFLRNMVRILAGTLIDVGQGRIDPAQVPEILASRDRTRAGRTAPAEGLTLVRVFYADAWPGPRPNSV